MRDNLPVPGYGRTNQPVSANKDEVDNKPSQGYGRLSERS